MAGLPRLADGPEHAVSYGHWTFLRILGRPKAAHASQRPGRVMEPTTFPRAMNADTSRRPTCSRKEIHVT
jgi:hypothetical protein